MLVQPDPAEPMLQVAVGDKDVFVSRGDAVSRVSKRGGFLRSVDWGSWLVGRIVASGSRVCWSYSAIDGSRCRPGDPICGDWGESKLVCSLDAGAHEHVIASGVRPGKLALVGDLLVWGDDGGGLFYASLSSRNVGRQRILYSGTVPVAVATDGVRVYWCDDESVWCLAPPSATPQRLAHFHPTPSSPPTLAALHGDVFWAAADAVMRWSAATGRVSDFADCHAPRDLVRAGNGVAWLDPDGTLRFAAADANSRVIAVADVTSVAADNHAIYYLQNGALRMAGL